MNAYKTIDFRRAYQSSSPTATIKIPRVNNSLISTRYESQHRSFKSTGKQEQNRKKVLIGRESPAVRNDSLGELREKLANMYKSLPKLPRSLSFGKMKRKEEDKGVKERVKDNSVRACGIYVWKESRLKRRGVQRMVGDDSLRIRESLYEFHSRSKLLLYQLEQNVLGGKNKNFNL